MTFHDFMGKIRYWDHRFARLMMGHFYFLFFQLVLVFIFMIFFATTLSTLDFRHETAVMSIGERLLYQQNIKISILIFLMLLNSFWMLFIFNGLRRIGLTLKDISFGLSRQKNRRQEPHRRPDSK